MLFADRADADYYEVLGVPRDADARAIKNAFRTLARRYHPDTSTEPDAEQRFREVAEAYGVLSDPARRASYDAGVPGGATAEDLWGGIDLDDVFGTGAAAFGGLFERLFGPPQAGPPRGQELRADLVLSLEEVLAGGTRRVTIRRPGPCPRCAGRGSRPGTVPRTCPDCGGTGQLATASRRGSLLVRQVAGCLACGAGGCSSTSHARNAAAPGGPSRRPRSPSASRPASPTGPSCGWPASARPARYPAGRREMQLREADSAADTTGEAAPPREPGAIRRRWRALTHRHAQDEVPAD